MDTCHGINIVFDPSVRLWIAHFKPRLWHWDREIEIAEKNMHKNKLAHHAYEIMLSLLVSYCANTPPVPLRLLCSGSLQNKLQENHYLFEYVLGISHNTVIIKLFYCILCLSKFKDVAMSHHVAAKTDVKTEGECEGRCWL